MREKKGQQPCPRAAIRAGLATCKNALTIFEAWENWQTSVDLPIQWTGKMWTISVRPPSASHPRIHLLPTLSQAPVLLIGFRSHYFQPLPLGVSSLPSRPNMSSSFLMLTPSRLFFAFFPLNINSRVFFSSDRDRVRHHDWISWLLCS